MLETTILKHVDDVKAIRVKDFITLRNQHFSALKEDFSTLKPYQTMAVVALSFPDTQAKKKGKDYGYISRYAHGRDYHLEFERRLKLIQAELDTLNIKSTYQVDKGFIDERFAALAAGLGYLGHNQFLIHPRYGTHLYLGVLLLDAPLTTTPYEQDSCGSCRKCIDACPTQALSKATFHVHRCLSNLSQAKAEIDMPHLKKFNYLFGCDICQDVCPKNIDITPVERPVFASDDAAQIHLETLLTMSNKAIMKAYKDYAFAWRGATVLKRNAMALMMNRGMAEHLPLLESVAQTYDHVPWFKLNAKKILMEMRTSS